VGIFEGVFAAVLKDRPGQMAAALGTNPFFGLLSICHNQAFELMFAVRTFDDIDRHQLTSFLAEIVVCDCWFVYLFQYAVPKRFSSYCGTISETLWILSKSSPTIA